MTAKRRHARNQTANEAAPDNEATDANTKNASAPESSTETGCANAGPTTAPTRQHPAQSRPPWPTIIRSAVVSWLRKARILTTPTTDVDYVSPAITVTLHEPSPEDGTRPEDKPDRTWEARNLTAVLEEQRLLGLEAEVLDLIRQYFHAEGTYLVCNRCGWTVTWITKHCAVRHGDDVQANQLW